MSVGSREVFAGSDGTVEQGFAGSRGLSSRSPLASFSLASCLNVHSFLFPPKAGVARIHLPFETLVRGEMHDNIDREDDVDVVVYSRGDGLTGYGSA